MANAESENHPPKGFLKWFLSWNGVAATLVLAAISYYLLTVHREHLALAIPYLVLLACPLIHIFGHGHGGHGSHSENKSDQHKH